VTQQDVVDLVRRAPFSFVGTIEHLGAGTMKDIPINDRTAVVRVDYVLHSPSAFATLEGHSVTLQLAANTDVPAVGESAAFFAEGVAFGESVALAEVGRLPVSAVEPQANAALAAGQTGAFADLQRQVQTEQLRDHAGASDSVVVGRVMKLESVVRPSVSEHDPDWWKATIDVYHVERGNVQPGPLDVLYPNSLDVRWRQAPKPKASQGGLWILHATDGDLRNVAPFQLLHPDDFQPVQALDELRG
jgi:hypothetical protein